MEWPKVMCYLLQKLIIFLDLKATTLLVMIFVAQPNLDNMLVSRKPMITLSVAYLEGMASIHLSWPEEGGCISTMKSRPHCWNGFLVERGFRGKGNSFLLPSKIWHLWQEVTNFFTSANKFGQ